MENERSSNYDGNFPRQLYLFRRMCDMSMNGLMIVQEGKVIYINDRLCEILGRTREELLNLTEFDLALPEDKDALQGFMKDAERTGIAPNKIEFWISDKDGKRRCIQNRYFYDIDNGEIKYRFIITTDVTENKQLMEELKKYRKTVVDLEQKQKNGLNIPMDPSISEKEKEMVFLTFFKWDFKLGPELERVYPLSNNATFSIEDVGVQLFHGAISIFGQGFLHKGQGFLLEIENIKHSGYIYFDIIVEGHLYHRFMLAVISPRINYFESLKIKEILEELGNKVKRKDEWDIKVYWEAILNVLTNPQS